jgi:hypothetical protein
MSLFPIQKLSYTRVESPFLPVKPENRPEFTYHGRRAFKGPPELLQAYLKGGRRFSEQRRQEIKSLHPASIKARERVSLWPNCKGVLDAVFNPFLKIAT